MGSLHKQATWTRPLSWEKWNYMHMQGCTYHPYETTADPVIAKGPEVMPDTVNAMPENPTGLLADHAKRWQMPRLHHALRILDSQR